MVYKIRRTILDSACFLWLLIGIAIFGFIGLFFRKGQKEDSAKIKRILAWTSNYIAPATEKVLDFKIAHRLVKEYFKGGKALDVAFGQGRFEEDQYSRDD